mmetsp:Transcript_40041/g.65642  ORF Transcript_40041/g.65642 Transcript_40041/m.65642 type:complete len:216 (-) Transcript_40041:2567-3214(-)
MLDHRTQRVLIFGANIIGMNKHVLQLGHICVIVMQFMLQFAAKRALSTIAVEFSDARLHQTHLVQHHFHLWTNLLFQRAVLHHKVLQCGKTFRLFRVTFFNLIQNHFLLALQTIHFRVMHSLKCLILRQNLAILLLMLVVAAAATVVFQTLNASEYRAKTKRTQQRFVQVLRPIVVIEQVRVCMVRQIPHNVGESRARGAHFRITLLGRRQCLLQ